MHDPARRKLILEAASQLMRHYGPFKTTVADIAKEAGVGVGTVYLEFRNKDAILAALSMSRYERVLRAMEHAWGDGRPAPARLERTLAARIEGFLGCVDGAHGHELVACSCPAIEASWRAYVEAERALFTRFLREAATRGELAVRDPEEDAAALLLAYRALEPPLVFALEREIVERDLARLHRVVLLGLLPRGC